MLTLVEALDYRCLRYVSRPLGPFHVLVGPNASGKTTFLDVVSLLGRLVSEGLDAAIGERTGNFQDLVWNRRGARFEVAVEAKIPADRGARVMARGFDTVRYEVRLGLAGDTGEIGILHERVLLTTAPARRPRQTDLFPATGAAPTTLEAPRHRKTRHVIKKTPGGNDNFYSEVYGEAGKGWVPTFRLGPRKSALANLPDDETKFPVATWLRQLLADGVQSVVLNSLLIRRASPPGHGRGFKTDGSNLPWVIAELERRSPDRLKAWVEHVRTALPDLRGIRTVEREDDRHRYLVIQYPGGLEVPSWMASDGTLRLLALTLPAYLMDLKGVYLVEEPENGIHPRAVETLYQSLSSVYDSQILLATHSPVVLSIAEADQVLCFAKTPEGATDIVPGSEHPALADWRGETNLGALFAAGVLG